MNDVSLVVLLVVVGVVFGGACVVMLALSVWDYVADEDARSEKQEVKRREEAAQTLLAEASTRYGVELEVPTSVKWTGGMLATFWIGLPIAVIVPMVLIGVFEGPGCWSLPISLIVWMCVLYGQQERRGLQVQQAHEEMMRDWIREGRFNQLPDRTRAIAVGVTYSLPDYGGIPVFATYRANAAGQSRFFIRFGWNPPPPRPFFFFFWWSGGDDGD